MLETTKDRILGCLKGVAIGDAVGKQTENVPFDEIKTWYPNGIQGFEGEIGTTIARYENRHYGWKLGETTDDTEQTIAVAKAIIEEGRVTHKKIGEKLMLCEKSNRPTLHLGRFQQCKDVNRVVYDGDGCGAAMRVAPIGILYPSDKLNELVSAVFESCIPTHGGQMAICAAASMAGAISAAIDGKSTKDIFKIAVEASIEARKYRTSSKTYNYDEILISMYEDLTQKPQVDMAYLSERYFPKTTKDIVPLSITLALITKSAEKSILLAANLGGDSDSVASMAASIAGAISPNTINNHWYENVQSVNDLELLDLAEKLYLLRRN